MGIQIYCCQRRDPCAGGVSVAASHPVPAPLRGGEAVSVVEATPNQVVENCCHYAVWKVSAKAVAEGSNVAPGVFICPWWRFAALLWRGELFG